MADPISPFTPDMQAQMSQLLQQQTDRSARTTPIHQAAMAMAARMAPGYAQGAMTGGGGSMPTSPLGITPSSSGGGIGPGIGTTVAASVFAALMKNPDFMTAIKKLFAGTPDFVGPTQAGDPSFMGPTQAADPSKGGLPIGGAPSSGGGLNAPGTFPGFFGNPGDPSSPNFRQVPIPGDPSNGGGYGGGFWGATDPRFE